jgi:aspartate aminotransferase-like enzyme
MPKRVKLMIPGPVDIWEDTLDALGQKVYAHYGPEWLPIYSETVEMVKQVFQTKNEVIIMTAPGSGAIEAGLASLFAPGEKVAVVVNGAWAGRIIEILQVYGAQPVLVENEWGQAADLDKMAQTLEEHGDVAGIAVVGNETSTGVRNPVPELARLAHGRGIPIFVDAVSAMAGYNFPVDEWEVDVVSTSSNKAFELPPGLGLISVSERAWDLIEAKQAKSHRGWYLNLSTWKANSEKRPQFVSPTTMATSLIVALRASLKRILEEETLEGHWARYVWARDVVRAGLRNLDFQMLAADDVASPTITAFWKRDDMADAEELREFMLKKHGFMLGSVGGPLAGKVIRLGHMGLASTQEYLVPCLLGIEDYIRTVKEVDVPVGASLIGLKDRETWY